MGALIGLLFGVGVALVVAAWRLPQERRAATTSTMRTRLERAGWAHQSPARWYATEAALLVLVTLGFVAATHALPVALTFGVLAASAPRSVLTSRARRRDRELAESWPDAVDQLASGVRAGLSLAESLAGLGERGPAALRPAFAAFARDYRASGRFGDCLDRLKERLSDPVGDRVVEGLRIAREVGGGDLGRLLRQLSGQLREEIRTRMELEARQSWTINGARLAVGAPWAVLLLMSFQPELMQRYASPAGATVLAIGAVTCVGAYRAMLRIAVLPAERRTFASAGVTT